MKSPCRVDPHHRLPQGEALDPWYSSRTRDFLELLIPKPRRRPDGRGRSWRDPRDILEAVMWILRTGAPWKDLPVRDPPYQTCHRRYQQWCRDGKIERALHALAEHLHEHGGIDITEAFIDGIFAGAEEGLRRRDRRSKRAFPGR